MNIGYISFCGVVLRNIYNIFLFFLVMVGDEGVGSIRILAKGFSAVRKTRAGWKRAKVDIPGVFDVIKLFEKNNYLGALVDVRTPRFLNGGLSSSGKTYGARVNVLPSGHVLDKAYSLFAKGLVIHDELSNSHWDAIFLNPNGKYSYLYSLEKKERMRKKKYSAVEDFDKSLGSINRAVNRGVRVGDIMALAMRTLLQTKMRVGSEIYYKAHGHKGLTTLKRGDVVISGKDVTFSYISKDGVPQKIVDRFSSEYVKSLGRVLGKLKRSDFIFANELGQPLKDRDFMKAFGSYCGEEFYPHIVRSHYATKEAEGFLGSHKKATKEEVDNLFSGIAERLGHKRYSKSGNRWETDYNATVHYYIKPKFVERILKLVG